MQALMAFKSLGCEGYGRIDFRVNSKWGNLLSGSQYLAGYDLYKPRP